MSRPNAEIKRDACLCIARLLEESVGGHQVLVAQVVLRRSGLMTDERRKKHAISAIKSIAAELRRRGGEKGPK
jgi:hypothetical protein